MNDGLKQIAEEIYKYQQTHEDWDSETADLPLDELQLELDCLDSWWYTDDFDEAELRETMKKAIDLADSINLYEAYPYERFIELSDEHTLWNIEGHISEDAYSEQVEQALYRFEEETGVKAFCLGRNGRHVCVESTYANASRLDELREKQRTIENEMVEFINSHYLDYDNISKEEAKNALERFISEEELVPDELAMKCEEYGLAEIVPTGTETLTGLENADISDGEQFYGNADAIGISFGAKDECLLDENGDRFSYELVFDLKGKLDYALRVNLLSNTTAATEHFTDTQLKKIFNCDKMQQALKGTGNVKKDIERD